MTSTKQRSGDGFAVNAWLIVGVVVTVVLLAGVIAIATTVGRDSAADSGVAQTRPVAVLGDALPRFPQAGVDPAVGMAAPVIAGFSFAGEQLMIEPGAPTAVVFLAHWCPHCQREVPTLAAWEQAGGVPDGAQVIGVATDTDITLPNFPPSRWLDREDFPFPVIADSETHEAAAAFGLAGFPFTVVLDSSGNVVERISGEFEPERLAALLTTVG